MVTDNDVMNMFSLYYGLPVISLYVESGEQLIQVLGPNGKFIVGPLLKLGYGVSNEEDVISNEENVVGPEEDVLKNEEVGVYPDHVGTESEGEWVLESEKCKSSSEDSYNPEWMNEELEGSED